MRTVCLYILLFFSPFALAQVEVVIEHMYVRDLVLTELESELTDELKTFQVLTEEQSSGYIYEISSAGMSQSLIQHNSSLFEKVKIYLDVEKWEFPSTNILTPVKFSNDGGEILSLKEYSSRVEAAKIEGLLRTGESFVTKELPHLDQRKALVYVELVKPAQIRCQKSEASADLTCQQVIQLRFKLQTDEYENFRSKGIEPVLVLRGEREKA